MPERAARKDKRSEKSAEAVVAPGRVVKRAAAHKALDTFKQRVRQITRRSGGRSLGEVTEQLRLYLPGWKACFQLAQTPGIFHALDAWLRHRLRALQLKHWRRGTTIYRELRYWVRRRPKRREWRAMLAAGGITVAWN